MHKEGREAAKSIARLWLQEYPPPPPKKEEGGERKEEKRIALVGEESVREC